MVRVEYIGAAWCAPCKAVKPRVQELCKKYGIDLVVYDYDDDLDDDARGDVKKLPTVRVYADGGNTLTEEFIVQQSDQLERWLSTNVRVMTTEDF
jgi:thiol-disulfide isomerase/thioredoxin